MSELRVMPEAEGTTGGTTGGTAEKAKALWPVAVMILGVVFAPAVIAWAILALHP